MTEDGGGESKPLFQPIITEHITLINAVASDDTLPVAQAAGHTNFVLGDEEIFPVHSTSQPQTKGL